MTGLKLLIVVLGALVCLSFAQARAADEVRHGFLDRVHKDSDGQESRYVLFIPYDYKGDRPYPLILFLHGAGESGTDGEKPAKVGIGPAIRRQDKTFPFITIFPQVRKRGLAAWGPDSPDGKRALAILEEVEKEFQVDRKRVYLTGLSMGGYGTWTMATRYPDRWAAIAPICGGGDPSQAEKIKHLPCWCFHGDQDRAVPVTRSRDMMKALWAAGGHPNYTEYPGVGHNSWDRAYATADLYDWFLKQHLP
jgi:predicted peptidase